METIKNINNWNEVTRGMFRYVIAAGACYEILIGFHKRNEDFMAAPAKLYITGDWIEEEIGSYFKREWIFEGTLEECLDKAAKDFSENQ